MKIVALMLTGEAFYAGRAKACYETWLQDFDGFQIHSFSPCYFLPITRVGKFEGVGSCLDKRHDGMFAAWRTLSHADWFCFASCDSFFWIGNLRLALTEIDKAHRNSALMVGGPRFVKEMDNGTLLIFPAGGGGYCLNRIALSLLLHNLKTLRADPEISRNDLAEDEFIGIAASRLGIRYVEHPGFHQANPMGCHLAWPFQVPREDAISYHYVTEIGIRAFHAEGKTKCCA